MLMVAHGADQVRCRAFRQACNPAILPEMGESIIPIDDPNTWSQGAAAFKGIFDRLRSAIGMLRDLRGSGDAPPREGESSSSPPFFPNQSEFSRTSRATLRGPSQTSTVGWASKNFLAVASASLSVGQSSS